jgi:hypothetical protein
MAEGRLSGDELEQRLAAAYAARTYGELDALLADLPTTDSAGRQRQGVARPAMALVAFVAFAFTLAVIGALAIGRIHSAVGVGVGPTPAGSRFQPPPASPPPDPGHALTVAASTVGAVVALMLCAALLWVLTRRGRRLL